MRQVIRGPSLQPPNQKKKSTIYPRILDDNSMYSHELCASSKVRRHSSSCRLLIILNTVFRTTQEVLPKHASRSGQLSKRRVELNPSLKLPPPSLLQRCPLRSSHHRNDPAIFGLPHSFEAWLVLDQGAPLPVVPDLGGPFNFTKLPASFGSHEDTFLVAIDVGSWSWASVHIGGWLRERMLGDLRRNRAGLLVCGSAFALVCCETLAPAISCTNVHSRLPLPFTHAHSWKAFRLDCTVFDGTSWLLFIIFNFDSRVAGVLLGNTSALEDWVWVGPRESVVHLNSVSDLFLAHLAIQD